MPSGTEFYVLDPRPEEVRIDDIAHCLAHTCRFHGSTRHHYSVAQHSVYVAWLLRRESAQTRLQALLHDASESYLPDLAPQVKRAIPGFRQLEAALWSAVAQRFELPEAKPPILKAADLACLWAELDQLLPEHRHPSLEGTFAALEAAFPALVGEARGLRIRERSPRQARERFLAHWKRTQAAYERERLAASG
jgi:5'-deoxynucleotidase YfbR-like HD superfamily hydrolase